MNPNIAKLYSIASRSERYILGLMSGTSLDGLDVALCRFTGSGLQTAIEVLQFETVNYNEDFKKEIKTVFSKKEVNLEQLTLLNPFIALQHANIVNTLLQKWNIKNEEVDIIASHGQTIYHAPQSLHQQNKFGNATLQIGDGDHLAVATGIITISDFRQKHIAAGGEGAPLAVYGDYLIFSKQGEDRVLLNIGGIANFTYLPGSMDSSKIFSTDTGPGNTMMDAYMQQQFSGKYFDDGAVIALAGKVNANLLTALKENIFFKKPFPKTTGPELFNLNYLQQAKERSATQNISIEDTMATLNKFSADAITDALQSTTDQNRTYAIFSSGGGMHNPLLMQHLKNALPHFNFDTTAALHINPDAKEAVLFAVLANECICGDNDDLQKDIAGMPAVSMGKISFPG
ncbi:anhydro-N-acetylmuramic acid kinase [Ferruginibacter sp. SUN106]|uniref:anhydro-N-acetylmuramic acid kinase n=1 Tax=Ferruginibacter sp. SUN106 TaxID=2978348 RepID=UPI003D36631E